MQNTEVHAQNITLKDIKPEIDKLVEQAKLSLKSVEKVAIDQAWKILQLAVVATIQVIENKAINLPGADKKVIAMDMLSKFYDSVFLVINIPFVPNLVEPIIHKYVKIFLMVLVSSTIDAMVTTFRNTGIFVDPNSIIDNSIDTVPKVSDK
jgi:hypothetical protein